MIKTKFFDYFDKVIFLTLSDAYERHQNIQNQINRFNIKNYYIYYSTKLPNIYLKCSNLFPQLKTDYYEDIKKYNKYIYANNFSVSINHLNIIKIFYELGYNKILILEDDINLNEYDGSIYDKIIDYIPENYDLLKFNNDDYKYDDLQENDLINPIFIKMDENEPNYGSNFYALSRNGMKIYIDYLLETSNLCEDLIFTQLLKNTNIKGYTFNKKIISPLNIKSTIL